MHTNIKTILKTSVAIGALLAVAAPVIISPVQAGINNGNENSLVMSGQIARTVVYQDNGDKTGWFHTDGIDTNSRIRYIVSGKISEAVSVGGVVEMNFLNSSGGYQLGGTDLYGDEIETKTPGSDWSLRKTEITFTHKFAGKLSIGKGSAAGDGASTNSLGAWGPSMSVQGKGGYGSSRFHTDAGLMGLVSEPGLPGLASDAVGQYDPSRIDRVRYDSPTFGGFGIAVSAGSNTKTSVGISYGAKFNDIDLSAAAFFERDDNDDTTLDHTLGGSIAIKHEIGLSAHAGFSRQFKSDVLSLPFSGFTLTEGEGQEWHIGLGYAANLTNLGTIGIAVNYSVAENSVIKGDEGTSIGFAINQNIASVGTDIFLAYSQTSYEQDSFIDIEFDDFSAIMVGTVLKF